MLKFLAERDSGDGLGGPFSPDFDERVLNRGIVGMARYVRAVRYGDAPSPEGQEFWFHGPFGWVLEDVYAFDVPIDVPGLQKLWHLHGTLRERVMMQARKAVGGGT